jgi:ribonuclease HII
MSIAHLKKSLEELPLEERLAYLEAYRADERKGVQRLIATTERAVKQHAALCEHASRLAVFDGRHGDRALLCGIDEAGRGPLAGPVVAAAVILPPSLEILGLDDSKKLSAAERDRLFDLICTEALAYGIGIVDEKTIDRVNILEATKLAMRQAVEKLESPCEKALVDAVRFETFPVPVVSIVRGDEKSAAIAAASVLAKVTRDRLMVALDSSHPGYDFASHKGYGTQKHYEALAMLGPSPVHRRSFL